MVHFTTISARHTLQDKTITNQKGCGRDLSWPEDIITRCQEWLRKTMEHLCDFRREVDKKCIDMIYLTAIG
jgi:hypothetical protein